MLKYNPGRSDRMIYLRKNSSTYYMKYHTIWDVSVDVVDIRFQFDIDVDLYYTLKHKHDIKQSKSKEVTFWRCI